MEENKDGEIATQALPGHQSNPWGEGHLEQVCRNSWSSICKQNDGATPHAGRWQSNYRNMYQSLGPNPCIVKTTNSYLYQNELGPGFKCKIENYKMFRER